MPTEARNGEQELMGVEGEGGGGTNGFHDHHELPDSPVSHDEGYFTSAVSVQHKLCTSSPLASETTTTAEHHEKMSTSSVSSTELDHLGRKVVWPCINKDHYRKTTNGVSDSIHHHKTGLNGHGGIALVDKPMAWVKNASTGGDYPRDANDQMEMDIQKRTLAAANSNRLTRSRSRHIMERARSFERAATEAAAGGIVGTLNASGYDSNASSRPISRSGSFSRSRRSPSVGRQLADHWQAQVERGSRSQSRTRERHPSVGRVDTSVWEQQPQEQQHPKTPPAPPKRRELAAPSPIPREESQTIQFPRGHVLDMLGQWPPSRPETPAPPQPPRPSSRVAMRTGFESPPPQRPESRGAIAAPPPPPTRATYAANTVREDNTDIAHHLNRASIQRLSEQADESKEQIVEEWVRQTTQQYNNTQQQVEEENAASTQQEMDEKAKDLELEKFAQDVAETVVTSMEKGGALGGTISSSSMQNEMNKSSSAYHQEMIHEQQFQQTSSSFATSNMSETNQIIQKDGKQQHQKSISGMFKAKPAQTSQDVLHRRRQDEEQWKAQKLQEQEERRKAEELEKIQYNEELKRQRKEEQRKKIEEKELEIQKQKMEEEQNVQRQIELRKMEDLKRKEKLKREQEKRLEMEKHTLHEHELRPAPRILRKGSFKAANDTNVSLKKQNSDQSKTKTGYVYEKRNFWLRSTENLHQRHEMSPGPRRRQLGGQDWIRPEATPEPLSRPGSSLGQAMAGSGSNVKTTVSNWSFLSKSKSSAAVMQDPPIDCPRPRSRNDSSIINVVSKYAKDKQERTESNERKVYDAHTNQVQDTLSDWGKQKDESLSGRNTPNPTRNISDKFADSKIGKEWKVSQDEKEEIEINSTVTERVQHKSGSTPWRTKTPEPGLKLLNVSVESPHGSNVHISENAEAQLASYIEQQQQQQQYQQQQELQQEQQQEQQQRQQQQQQQQMSNIVEISKTSSSSIKTSMTNSITTSHEYQQERQEATKQIVEEQQLKLQQKHLEEQEKKVKQEEQKRMEVEREKKREEISKKEELRKFQEEQYKIEKKKAQKALETQRKLEEEKRQDELRKLQEQTESDKELERLRVLEEKQKADQIKIEQEEILKKQELQRKEEEEHNRQQLELKQQQEERLNWQHREEEQHVLQKQVQPANAHQQSNRAGGVQQQQYQRQFQQIEPRGRGITTQVSSHLGSGQYLQTSERVTSVPPRAPSRARTDRGKSATPDRSKLIVRAEHSPPPTSTATYLSSDTTELESTSSTALQEHKESISLTSTSQQNSHTIISTSSGEISGPMSHSLPNTDSQQQQQLNIITATDGSGSTTPLPVLTEWINEENLRKQQEEEEAKRQQDMLLKQKLEREAKELERKQREVEQRQKLAEEQKLKQEQKIMEMENKRQKEKELQKKKDLEKQKQLEDLQKIECQKETLQLQAEIHEIKHESEGQDNQAMLEEEICRNERQELTEEINIITEAKNEQIEAPSFQQSTEKEYSEEFNLKEELMKTAKDKQLKGKRDKKKTNAYTTEELELLQKKRLQEYRKTQEQRTIEEDGTATETGSVHTELSASATQAQLDDYELQQDIFLRNLKEEKINEQKLLKEAIKGKVRGNIEIFQRASSREINTKPPGRAKVMPQVKQVYSTTSSERDEEERTQRAKELEAIALARANSNWEDGDEEKQRELYMREEKSKELQEVAAYRVTSTDMWEDITDAEERAKLEKEKRRQELQEVASKRTKTKWEQVVSSPKDYGISSYDPELEVARATIRDNAIIWQEREQSLSSKQNDIKGQRSAPTRRIGDMFSHTSNQWKMDDGEDEDFPAPPTEDEVNSLNEFPSRVEEDRTEDIAMIGIVDITEDNITGNTVEEFTPRPENVNPSLQPAPPPRDSSKEYMREWSRDEVNSSMSHQQPQEKY